MIVSGSGTRDSPITLDDESEDEVITELFNYPPSYSDPESTPLLSPRPGTILTTIPRLHLSEASAQSLMEYREDLQQRSHSRKRKRPATPPGYHDGNSAASAGDPGFSHIAPGVNAGGLRREGRQQRKLRIRLQREKQAAAESAKGKQKAIQAPNGHTARTPLSALPPAQAPPAKRPKHNNGPTNLPVTPPNHLPPIFGQASASTPSTSHAPGPSTPYLFPRSAPLPVTERLLPSGHPLLPIIVPDSDYPYPASHSGSSFPLCPPVSQIDFDLYMSHPASMIPEAPSPMTMDFDPMLPWATSMAIPGIPGPSMPISMPFTYNQMSSLSMTSMDSHSHKPSASQILSAPRKAVKTSTKSQVINAKPQPKKSQPIKKKPQPVGKKSQPTQPPPHQLKPEKPFTIRHIYEPVATSISTCTPVYIPIGKPDFLNKHGVFPIIPCLMFPPSLPGIPSLSPNPSLDRTLILENIPKHTCDRNWIKNWCIDACGVLPKRVLLGPRRALVEFSEPENAIDAWASRKLGVDEHGYRVLGVGGEAGEDNIIAFWYRPDAEGERKLLELWRGAKKFFAELKGMLATHVEERDLIKVLERKIAALGKMTKWEEGEVHGTSASAEMSERVESDKQQLVMDRVGFQKLAERKGFRTKLMKMKKGLTEEELAKWEQKEISKIERQRRLGDSPKRHKRQSEVEREEGEIMEEGSPRKDFEDSGNTVKAMRPPGQSSTFGPPSTVQPISVLAPRPNQEHVSGLSTSNITTTTTALSSTSVSGLPPALNTSVLPTTLPAKPMLLQPSSTIPTIGKPAVCFGRTAWGSPTRTPPSSARSKLRQPCANLPLPPKPVASLALTSSSTLMSVTLSVPTTFAVENHDPEIELVSSTPETILRSTSTLPLSIDRLAELNIQGEAPEPLERVSSLSSDMSLGSSTADEQNPVVAAPVTHEDRAERAVTANAPGTTAWEVGEEKLAEGLRSVGRGLMKPSLDSSALAGTSPGADMTGLLKSVVLPSASSSLLSTLAPRSELPLNQTSANATASTSTGNPGSSSEPSTHGLEVSLGDMDTSSTSEDGGSDQVSVSRTVTVHQIMTRRQSTVSTPTPPSLGIPFQALQELKRILARSIEERQNFLDSEFKATRVLMDRLIKLTCKKERKKVTDTWKEKIRIIDEVTKSIRNDAKVWYSQETKTWVRMRWPDCSEGTGVLVVTDDED